jgi:hypothetical protein
MSRITAHFNIPLAQYLYAKNEEKEFFYKTKINDFDIEVRLPPDKYGPRSKHRAETQFTYCISEILIDVSKELAEDIPPIIIDGRIRDYKLRGQFIMDISRPFAETAQLVLNRIIRYFKYALHQPLLDEITGSRQWFLSPTWFDEKHNEISSGVHILESKIPPGLRSDDFGVSRLTTKSEPELGKAIEDEIEVELYEIILSDAQSAVFQKNYRRAVLEMAMACELVIKQTYFLSSTVAGRAYEFMEDRQKVSMKIIDYIDGVAEYTWGETFEKVSSKADYLNIQHLFRGRNKVVHRGELAYRDYKGTDHPIDLEVLKRWWKSLELLLAWLKSKRSAQQ